MPGLLAPPRSGLVPATSAQAARRLSQREHPFRVIKQQFGFAKLRFKGLAKNTARLHMLFALSNLRMVQKLILQRTQVPSIG